MHWKDSDLILKCFVKNIPESGNSFLQMSEEDNMTILELISEEMLKFP